MKIIGLLDEDFINYKKASMTIMFPYCSFKCKECQNIDLKNGNVIEIEENALAKRYINNPITQSIVCQGLEPMDSVEDLKNFIRTLRVDYSCDDDVVIYTGYNKNEINNVINELREYKNIIIKFGRFIPDQEKHYDETLGVYLASDNQYAEKIS